MPPVHVAGRHAQPLGAAEQLVVGHPLMISLPGNSMPALVDQRLAVELSTAGRTDWLRILRARQAEGMSLDLPENLDRLTQIQRGILSAALARRGGLSTDSVKSRLRCGKWQHIHRGVYATFTGKPPREALMWAAVLRAGPGALLSYYTAAELDGLSDVPRTAVHITIPESRRIIPVRGMVVHLSSRTEMAAHPTALPPRTRIEETVLDLAQLAPTSEDACAWIARGLGRRLTNQERLRALSQRERIRFRPELAELLQPEWAGHSGLEYRYVKWVEVPHLLPRGKRQVRAESPRGIVYRDVLYDEFHLIVELDGAPPILETLGGRTLDETTPQSLSFGVEKRVTRRVRVSIGP